MNRKAFLQCIGIILGASFSANSLSEEVQFNQLYTRADQRIYYPPEKASTLAFFILHTQNKKEGIRSYREASLPKEMHDHTHYTYLTIDYQGTEYTIALTNTDTTEQNALSGGIRFWIRPESREQRQYIYYADNNLDGQCDAGFIPKGVYDNHEDIRFATDSNGHPLYAENQQLFQDLYNQTLDALLAFYAH